MTKLYKWLNDNNFPSRQLPEDYVNFIKNNTCADFSDGERLYQFLDIDTVMEYYDAYMFPKFMPYAFPFAMDGNGSFYIFNMRQYDECVYIVDASCLCWDEEDYIKIADCFYDIIENFL